MSGGIHNVDTIIVPIDGRVLGQNGNAPLTLLIIGIHDALGASTFAIQRARLLQQAVNERGFPMINVGDNGDVAERFHTESGL